MIQISIPFQNTPKMMSAGPGVTFDPTMGSLQRFQTPSWFQQGGEEGRGAGA